MPHVETDNRNLLVAHTARNVEEGAVAPHTQHKVGCKIIGLDELTGWDVNLQPSYHELMKAFFDGNLRSVSRQNRQQFLNSSSLALLKSIAKEGKA